MSKNRDDLVSLVNMTEMVNKMPPVVSRMIPVIDVVIDNSIMFMEINLVVENNSSEL